MPRDKVGLLFQWVNKRGPFLDDYRQVVDDDLFMFGEDDVTDLGLGEAARRIVVSKQAASYSSTNKPNSRYSVTPLDIVHGLLEEPIDVVSVPNFTNSVELAEVLYSVNQPEPTTWNELLNHCRVIFDGLNIGAHCEQTLARFPYSPAAGRRIANLLAVLQDLVSEMDEKGKLSAKGVQLYNTYFVGERAWFSDESPTRRADSQKFTFPDPNGSGHLVCYWHGKVSTPPYRLHFEWPLERPAERLRVTYIGPHL